MRRANVFRELPYLTPSPEKRTQSAPAFCHGATHRTGFAFLLTTHQLRNALLQKTRNPNFESRQFPAARSVASSPFPEKRTQSAPAFCHGATHRTGFAFSFPHAVTHAQPLAPPANRGAFYRVRIHCFGANVTSPFSMRSTPVLPRISGVFSSSCISLGVISGPPARVTQSFHTFSPQPSFQREQ